MLRLGSFALAAVSRKNRIRVRRFGDADGVG
jgi:hypothetical protein